MGLFSRSNRPEPDELAEIHLFADLGSDELAAVAKLAVRREVTAGEIFIEQGRFGDSFFVIAEGRALVFVGGAYVAAVGAGSAVGEIALVERLPRNATVQAETSMVLAEFGIAEFRTLLEEFPSANLRINELLNRRLRENLDK